MKRSVLQSIFSSVNQCVPLLASRGHRWQTFHWGQNPSFEFMNVLQFPWDLCHRCHEKVSIFISVCAKRQWFGVSFHQFWCFFRLINTQYQSIQTDRWGTQRLVRITTNLVMKSRKKEEDTRHSGRRQRASSEMTLEGAGPLLTRWS